MSIYQKYDNLSNKQQSFTKATIHLNGKILLNGANPSQWNKSISKTIYLKLNRDTCVDNESMGNQDKRRMTKESPFARICLYMLDRLNSFSMGKDKTAHSFPGIPEGY